MNQDIKIELQQTSTRAVFIAYHNRELIGEFRGYGKTEDDKIASAREQAQAAVSAKSKKVANPMVDAFLAGKCDHPI